jgi:DNA polymerase III delta prime subunit
MNTDIAKESSINFLSWQPRSWDQMPGNYRIKKFFLSLARTLRKQIAKNKNRVLKHMCFLLSGAGRSGKTAATKLLIRCIVCKQLDEVTMTPCDGTCKGCQPIFENTPEGESGMFVILETPENRTPVHFFLINCAKIYSPAELKEKLTEISQYAGSGYIIVYLDEVHRLVQRQMDQMLLKEVEEAKYLWFFSTAKPQGLEDMFQNRLLIFETELPTVEEMEKLLVDLCDESGITWEPEGIVRAIEKSNRIIGHALRALALASINPEGLTMDLIENDWFVKIEERASE